MDERALSLPPASTATAKRRIGESSRTRIFAAVLALGGCGFILAKGDSLLRFTSKNWEGMLLWGAILLLVNLFPIQVSEMTLTLDMPILLAVAILYPPEAAAFVALLSGVDVREFSGGINPTRAVFNRAQIATSVSLAGFLFHWISPQLTPPSIAIGGAAASLLCFHSVNVLLVSCFTVLRTRRSMRTVLGEMIVGDWREFLPTYLGFGALALILAFLYENVGGWSVVLFLVPLLVARQALVREQRLQKLAQTLKERERLLQRLFDQMADERKDERKRIAFDLHDDVLQSLVRISQLGGFIQQDFEPLPQLSKDVDELILLSKSAGEKVRHVIQGLDVSGVGRDGLVATLSGLARDLEKRWHTKISLDVLLVGDLPPSVELCAYQVAKEALENASRYSHASEIRVSLTVANEMLHVTVADDGVGFDFESVDRTSHFGLRILEARSHLAGGRFRVSTSPGKGTRVEAGLPLKRTRPEKLSLNFSGPD